MNQAPRSRSSNVPPPRMIAVAAGRLGVGASTMSVNLAIALAQHGQRTVIVDADLARADVARYCGVAALATIADVLAGRRSIHEVLERGPGGIQLAAGSTSPQCRTLCTERSIRRLLSQIQALGRHADAVVIDAGSAPTDLTGRIWQAADRLLLVTTPDAIAVMDAYALTKSLLRRQPESRSLDFVVNQASTEAHAHEVHDRMHRSCQRFLQLKTAFAGWLPQVRRPVAPPPWLLAQPLPPVAQHIERIAARLLSDQYDPVHEAA